MVTETELRKAYELLGEREGIQSQLQIAKDAIGAAFAEGGRMSVIITGWTPAHSRVVELSVDEPRDRQVIEDWVLTMFDRRLDVCDRALEELGVEV